MTAPIDPEQNPHSAQNPRSLEDQTFIYDDPNTEQNRQYDAEYVPEREFVLMPLFRRIGELLGIRRDEPTEYIYEPEPETHPLSTTVAVKADLLDSRESPAADSYEIPSYAELASEASQAPWESSHEFEAPSPVASPVQDIPSVGDDTRVNATMQAESEPEDKPGITPEIAGPVAVQGQAKSEPEVVFETQADEPVELEVFTPAAMHLEADPVASTPAQSAEGQQLELAIPRQQAEASDLVASLREATLRISTAISQAAERLYSKEEEILRRSQSQLAPPRPHIEEPRQVGSYARTASEPFNAAQEPSTEPTKRAPHVPTWEVYETPALQREMAWRDQPTDSAGTTQPNFARSHNESRPAEGMRPKLVPTPPRRPFWKRVDWAQRFTPKRVAILGAVAMALSLVAGISLAKRPASSELPQQTRAIEPGGVTLSTHPSGPAVSQPVPQRQDAVPQRRATQARPAHRAANYDDGPEVVTHYYNRKPSPIKQSTVAGGVRHYSDMP